MKLPKKQPKATVRVYPAGKDTYKMIVLKPQELATFRQEGTKWITEDGTVHRTHRDAMRHIALGLKDKDLLRAVPAPVLRASIKNTVKQELNFQSPQDVLRYAVSQEGFADFLLKALDQYTKPERAVNDAERTDKTV